MENYHNLLQTTLEQGAVQFNVRTNKLCRVLVGCQLQYDMADGFPAITTKKPAFNNMKGELLGFFRGYENAEHVRLFRLGYYPALRAQDHEEILMERSINQPENALRAIITNPSDRRMIVSGWNPAEWNPAELDQVAMPLCHMDYRFVAFEDSKTLHVVMTISSWDLFLGAPLNIASTSLFLAIMARLAGYTPGTVTIQATNAHLYEDHFDQVREILTRSHFDAPRLILSDRIKPVGLGDIAGAFTRIEPSDISLEGYRSHAAIKAPMAD